MTNLTNRLLEKSKEAFSMAIELYNKPTIKYRVEGFSMFICNAWELMLKSYMIKTFGEMSIYYSDNKNRTITLENCIKKVFTNEKDPLRLNLEKIIELRNTSTHFITEEYEMVYVPLFQSCLFNFNEKMTKFHNIDMTEIIPQNFLTLAVSMRALSQEEIVAKYPEEIATKLISVNNNISDMVQSHNNAFAIRIEHYHYLTKDVDKATSLVRIDKNAETPVKIIKDIKDPNDTHKYTTKNCIKEICSRLDKLGISLIDKDETKKFNAYHFELFCKYYSIKTNKKFCYTYKLTTNPTYSYSIQTIDLIVDEIKKDPEHIVPNLKEYLKNK